MSTETEVVALIGAASTLGVAAAGYFFNFRNCERDRDANRRLADERNKHERELAEVDADAPGRCF